MANTLEFSENFNNAHANSKSKIKDSNDVYTVTYNGKTIFNKRCNHGNALDAYEMIKANEANIVSMLDKFPNLEFTDTKLDADKYNKPDKVSIVVDGEKAHVSFGNVCMNEDILSAYKPKFWEWVCNVESVSDFEENTDLTHNISITEVYSSGSRFVIVVDHTAKNIWPSKDGQITEFDDPAFDAAIAKLKMINKME